MNYRKLVWKLFSIHKKELSFVVPLFFIYFLSGSFFTVGQIFSETLFLKAYGAKGYSRFFIQNGFALIAAGILYNYFIRKVALHRGYIYIVGIFSTLIISASFIVNNNFEWTYFYMYMGNYLATFFLDMHFFNYAFEFLSVRNSKRVLPFLMSGGKLGGIFTSLIIYYLLSKQISGIGFYLWAGIGFTILIPIIYLNATTFKRYIKRHEKHKHLSSENNFFEKIIHRVMLSYKTPIFLFSVLVVFVMSVSNQISEYYFALAFNSYFKTKSELASFLSIYTFIADLATLALQIFITSKIIKYLGVKKSNYMYPGSFALFMVYIMLFPGLIGGILLRFYRKNLSLIIRTPIYNVIMASSPRDRMTEVKSFISGIISPVGMVGGGFAIVLLYKHFTPREGYILALTIGVIYLILTFFQNKAYVQALRNRLVYDHTERYIEKICYDDYKSLFKDEESIKDNLTIIEDIYNANPCYQALEQIQPYFKSLADETKEKILYFLHTGSFTFTKIILVESLTDESIIVRATAYSLLHRYNLEERSQLLSEVRENKQNRKILFLFEIHSFYTKSEKLVLYYLTGKVQKDELDKHFQKVKKSIFENQKDPLESAIIFSLFPEDYLSDLVEIAIKRSNDTLFQFIIPYTSNLQHDKALELLKTYSHSSIKLIISFCSICRSLKNIDKVLLLESRKNIKEQNMDIVFRYTHDDATKEYIIDKLFSSKHYYIKSNYLNYLMSIHAKHERQISMYIQFELNNLTQITQYIETISSYNSHYIQNQFIAFTILSLIDVMELHKHLILKAVSILAGIDVDEVYESNLLLKDSELSSIIFEYIESAISDTKEIIELFEKLYADTEKTEEVTESAFIKAIIEAWTHLQSFIPEMNAVPINFETYDTEISYEEIARDIYEEEYMLQLMEKVIFLKQNSLFCDLETNELLHLAKITNELHVKENNFIIREGDIGDELFIIIDGEVDVFANEKTIATLGVGACLGELSVIDSEPRSTNVKTIKETKFLSIKRKDFLLTLRDQPTISINVMKILATRLRNSVQ